MPTKAEIKRFEEIQKDRRKRALGYALSLVAFQEVGAGEDKFLGDVREIVYRIRELCQQETGEELESYPIEFLKSNAKEIKENYPFVKNFI